MDFVHPVEALIPGTQGRVLAVPAETTAELNLRTVARLAGISAAQASRVLRGLVELARTRNIALERMGAAARELAPLPVSVIVFGSFARHEADRQPCRGHRYRSG